MVMGFTCDAFHRVIDKDDNLVMNLSSSLKFNQCHKPSG